MEPTREQLIELLRKIQTSAELGDDEYHVPIEYIIEIDKLIGLPL